MSQRLYLAPELAAGATRTLDSDDSHYLARVLRLKAGAALRCFDGRGDEWDARLTTSSTRASVVTLGELIRSVPEPGHRLHLAQGWLKGQAMDQTVQKSTELGISDFWPIVATRSNVKLDEARTRNRVRHWQRIARSAAEQSERLFLPVVHDPQRLADFLAAAPCDQLLFLEPGCDPLPSDVPEQSLGLLVGPEGGWAPEESQAARAAGAGMYGLGSLVLRAETAPLAALAAIRHGWGWAS
ncbi:MAG: 16S rRNA (uracil(1498)-N(3))-methyltransferase [Gammaproteobacteria bacterium]|nr:16S rRNA (uracil(1498)-N(3))-methyltransferase [Gammaproteobacteria bacterium]